MKSKLILVNVILLTMVMISCSDKKEVKTHFSSANEAFSYFIDTTGLVRDQKDSTQFFSTSKLKGNYKVIFSNSYEIYTKYGAKLYIKPIDFIIEIFNENGQLKRRYLKFYEEKQEVKSYNLNEKVYSIKQFEKNIIHVFKYNEKKQLVRFYILEDESNRDDKKSRLAGVNEFKYFNSSPEKDSVFIESYGFSNPNENGFGIFSYDQVNNKIDFPNGAVYYYSQLQKNKKLFYRLNKNKGIYILNSARY